MRCLAALAFTALVQSAVADGLPAYLLQLPDSIDDVFVADTGTATLYRYVRTDDGVRLAGTTYMSIGENGAGKEREWDRRTPLGIYFVVDRLDTARLHEKYGVMAFPLDYPNARDRHAGRTGNGIWVHGVPPGGERRPAFDTDGCIALPNEELARLEPAFVPARTPVVVTRALRYAAEDERERIVRELREAVYAWAHAWAAGDAADYVAQYAANFTYRGLAHDEWAVFRKAAFAERGTADVAVGDLLLLAEPEDPGIYLSRFRLRTVHDGGRAFEGTKRLWWRRDSEGFLKVIAEDSG